MDTSKKILVLGGDTRQIFCADALSVSGFETVIFGFDKYKDEIGLCTKCNNLYDAVNFCDIVVLPVPACSDEFNINMPLSNNTLSCKELFDLLNPSQTVFYGKFSKTIDNLAKSKNIKCYDYYSREEFQIENAIPTAESALAIAINETPVTIFDSTCLVMGYGRIGKIVCKYLKSLGATVYASARKYPDLSWISTNNYIPVNTSEVQNILSKCDIIINTIPEIILKDNLLKKIKKNTLIIDLASKPGGVDFESAKKEGLNVIWALSLPGKTAPITAGNIICNTILNILSETEG